MSSQSPASPVCAHTHTHTHTPAPPVATSRHVFIVPFISLTDSDEAGWWPLLSGWQGEIETSVSSDFTVRVKPSLIAWLTELAEGLASDRVPRGGSIFSDS